MQGLGRAEAEVVAKEERVGGGSGRDKEGHGGGEVTVAIIGEGLDDQYRLLLISSTALTAADASLGSSADCRHLLRWRRWF